VCVCVAVRAMASASGREQFLKQFEQIVEGVKQNRTKVSILHTDVVIAAEMKLSKIL